MKWYKTIEFAKKQTYTTKAITFHIKMGNDARRIASAKKQMAEIHTKKHSDARSLRLKKTKEVICKNLEMGIVAETLDDAHWGRISLSIPATYLR